MVNINVAILLVVAKLKDISEVRNEDNKRLTNWKQIVRSAMKGAHSIKFK